MSKKKILTEKDVDGLTKQDVVACGYVSATIMNHLCNLMGKIEAKEPPDAIIDFLKIIDTEMKSLQTECDLDIGNLGISIDRQIELAKTQDWARLWKESINLKNSFFSELRTQMGVFEPIPFKRLLEMEQEREKELKERTKIGE